MSSYAIDPLSSVNSKTTAYTTSAAETAVPVKTQPAATPVSTHEDKVQLSQAAQVIDLYREGQSAKTISSKLGISVSVVDSYLGILEKTAIATSGASVKA